MLLANTFSIAIFVMGMNSVVLVVCTSPRRSTFSCGIRATLSAIQLEISREIPPLPGGRLGPSARKEDRRVVELVLRFGGDAVATLDWKPESDFDFGRLEIFGKVGQVAVFVSGSKERCQDRPSAAEHASELTHPFWIIAGKRQRHRSMFTIDKKQLWAEAHTCRTRPVVLYNGSAGDRFFNLIVPSSCSASQLILPDAAGYTLASVLVGLAIGGPRLHFVLRTTQTLGGRPLG